MHEITKSVIQGQLHARDLELFHEDAEVLPLWCRAPLPSVSPTPTLELQHFWLLALPAVPRFNSRMIYHEA